MILFYVISYYKFKYINNDDDGNNNNNNNMKIWKH